MESQHGGFINDFVEVYLEDGIIHVIYYVPNTHLTLEMAQRGVEERLRLSNGRTLPLFADIRNIKKVEKEARQFLSSKEGTKLLSAGAFLVGGAVDKLLDHAFLFINKPLVPSKLFTNQTRAIEWLKLQELRFMN